MKLRDLEKLINDHYTKEISHYKDREANWKKERDKLKAELLILQKQKFFLRMQNIGRLMVQYKKEEEEGLYPNEVRESRDNRPIGYPKPNEQGEVNLKFREKKIFRMEREEVAS
jgi:hypothetical protein